MSNAKLLNIMLIIISYSLWSQNIITSTLICILLKCKMLIFFVHENVLTITISARDKITFYSSIASYLFIVPFYANHNVTID